MKVKKGHILFLFLILLVSGFAFSANKAWEAEKASQSKRPLPLPPKPTRSAPKPEQEPGVVSSKSTKEQVFEGVSKEAEVQKSASGQGLVPPKEGEEEQALQQKRTTVNFFKRIFNIGSGDKTKGAQISEIPQKTYLVQQKAPKQPVDVLEHIKDTKKILGELGIADAEKLGKVNNPNDFSEAEKARVIELGNKLLDLKPEDVEHLAPEEKLKMLLILRVRTIQLQMADKNLAGIKETVENPLKSKIEKLKAKSKQEGLTDEEIEKKIAEDKEINELRDRLNKDKQNVASLYGYDINPKTGEATKQQLLRMQRSQNLSQALGEEIGLRYTVFRQRISELQRTDLTAAEIKAKKETFVREFINLQSLIQSKRQVVSLNQKLFLENKELSKDEASAKKRLDEEDQHLKSVQEGLLKDSKKLLKSMARDYLVSQNKELVNLSKLLKSVSKELENKDKANVKKRKEAGKIFDDAGNKRNDISLERAKIREQERKDEEEGVKKDEKKIAVRERKKYILEARYNELTRIMDENKKVLEDIAAEKKDLSKKTKKIRQQVEEIKRGITIVKAAIS